MSKFVNNAAPAAIPKFVLIIDNLVQEARSELGKELYDKENAGEVKMENKSQKKFKRQQNNSEECPGGVCVIKKGNE